MTAQERRLRLGLIGCGAIAKEHLAALRRISGIELVAVCDVNRKAALRVGEEWGANCYGDPGEMMANENLSLVSILTPPQTHSSIAVEAITRGVNLLVEKPLAMSSREATEILKSLSGSKVKLTVNYNWLLSRKMMEALSIMKAGRIGDVLHVGITILHTPEDEMASNENHWSHKLPGGRFGEMLAHPVYLAQSVLGDELKVDRIVAAKRGNLAWMRWDELFGQLHNSNGVASVYISFNAPRPEIGLVIFGARRILQIDLLNQTLIQLGPRTLSKMDSARDCFGISINLAYQAIQNSLVYLARRRGESALQLVYESIAKSITDGGDPIVTAAVAYDTVKIVEDICSRL